MSLIDREKTLEEIPIDVCDGFEVTDIIEKMPTVQAIPLAKVKQAKEDIEKIQLQGVNTGVIMQKDVLAILDKLIAESEGVND